MWVLRVLCGCLFGLDCVIVGDSAWVLVVGLVWRLLLRCFCLTWWLLLGVLLVNLLVVVIETFGL